MSVLSSPFQVRAESQHGVLREAGDFLEWQLRPPKCLQGVPFLRVERESKAANDRTDLRLQVRTPGGKSTLVVEVRKVGQPRVIREATNQLLRFKNELPGAYGVVMAPYM
jgi:hypothetical protein